MKYILLSIIILTGLSCYAQSQEAKNIAMFSNLYGAVRWFCPSDEVADMDWEKFAAYGVNKVLDIETERELADTLYALFSPIVPALRINYGKSLAVGIASAADAVDDVTYWQRQGVFLTPGNIWVSGRTNHFKGNVRSPKVFYYLDNVEKDERILLEVKIRNSDNVLAGLSLVENRYGSKGWESGAQNTPVDDRDWRVYKVEFIPEQRSDFITLGIYFLSTGIIEVEYIKIERGNESLMFRGATQLENEWNFRTNYSKTHTK